MTLSQEWANGSSVFKDSWAPIGIFLRQRLVALVKKGPGPRFNIKMTSYQYMKSHCGDKTILRPSYLHNGISYTGKTTSLYWIKAQDIGDMRRRGHVMSSSCSDEQCDCRNNPHHFHGLCLRRVFQQISVNLWKLNSESFIHHFHTKKMFLGCKLGKCFPPFVWGINKADLWHFLWN